TAAEAGYIADTQMLPSFRAGDYGTGILNAVAAIAIEYAEFFDFELTGELPPLRQPERSPSEGSAPFPVALIMMLVIVVLFVLFSRGGGGPWRGGRRRHSSILPYLILGSMLGGRHRGGRGTFGGF